MRTRATLILATCAATMSLAACGGDGGDSADLDPATLVPKDAPLYGEVTVRPDGETKEAVEGIIRRFPGGEDPARGIRDLLQALSEDGDGDELLEGADEWAGRRIGFFTTDLEADDVPIGVVASVRDRDKAEDGLKKALAGEDAEEQSAGDVKYDAFEDDEGDTVGAGFVEDALVVADEKVFEQIAEDGGNDGIEGESDFADARDDAEDALGFIYLDSSAVEKSLEDEGVEPSELRGVDFDDPTTATVDASRDRLTIDVTGPLGGAAAQGGIFEKLPAGSVVALSLGDLESSYGALLKGAFQAGFTESAKEDGVSAQEADRLFERAFGVSLDEAFGAFGEIGAFARVGGITDFGAAIVAEVRDVEDARRTVRAARQIVRSESDARVGDLPEGLPEGAGGFSVRIPGFPLPLLVAGAGERLVIALGEGSANEALDPERTLGAEGRASEIERALGRDFKATGFVDLGSVLGLTGPLSAFIPEVDAVRRYVEPVELVATGTGEVGGQPASRTVIRFGGD